ncbi:Trypsin-like peptidase domain-containing protein [Clostridium cavendishii DSM 21758]|uniref:Trypsin-like peptidase domain-containing protein n=1 Tax=Clostridium cavendishii DSM 21758 TaxID=1121302 RepID=A0A1M6GJ32_9CLOT|nr:trypsin-like peptidase domain-containing protein [Clostridium cavendishii]SHJ09931.1 Trypsin-like peptidase domain-containing protein [Clostridium cavendishii DSM 21758]
MFKKRRIRILTCLLIITVSILSGCSINKFTKNNKSNSNSSISDSKNGKITLTTSKIDDQTKNSNYDTEKKKVKEFLDKYFKKYYEWGFNDASPSTLDELYVKDAMPSNVISFEYLVGKYKCKVNDYDFDIAKVDTQNGKITSLLAKVNMNVNATLPDTGQNKDIKLLYAIELIPYKNTYQVKSFYLDTKDNIKDQEQKIEEKQNGYNDKTKANETVTDFTPKDSNKVYGNVQSNSEKAIEEIIQENDPKTVALLVPNGDTKYAIGSGFFIAPGIVATNYHVIDGGCNALIRTNDAKIYEAEGIIAADKTVDIAIIKVKKKIGQPVQLGDVSKIKKGEKALAIGSPKGLFNTVSTGIISNIWNDGKANQIQISIPITHGNSGGPLFNSKGEVLGLTTSGIEAEGELNFAVSIEHIYDITDKLNKTDFDSIKAKKLSDVFNKKPISNLKAFASKFGTLME